MENIIRSEAQIQLILDEYEATGFSIKDYCEIEGINETIFHTWLKKYRSHGLYSTDDFSTMKTVRTNNQLSSKLFAEINKIKLYEEMPVEYLKGLLS